MVLLISGLSAIFLIYIFVRIARYLRWKELDYVDSIQSIPRGSHFVSDILQQLIIQDGAGSWPPRAAYGDYWPLALRPYHEIYLELASSLSVANIPSDSRIIREKRQQYRNQMCSLLSERVNLEAVEATLEMSSLPPEAYNGLFACISHLRHAYRWAIVPLVKEAQEETVIELPMELNLPWNFLRQRFGITSPGGNVTSNFYCNYDENELLVYAANGGMPEIIRSAEYHFGRVFPAMERLGLPVYYHMVLAIISFEQMNEVKTLEHLKKINMHLRRPLKVFFDALVDSKIPHKVWMRYVQGFQGWAAGEMVEGKYVEYDGLSGNQLLLLHCVDAFLGIDPYLPVENTLRYIPQRQREVSAAFRKYSFRQRAEKASNFQLVAEMENIAKQIRLFRASHRSRVSPYLSVPAAERFIMTAGKSVLESATIPNVNTAIQFLDAILLKRFQETK